jgi:hypothetical protein
MNFDSVLPFKKDQYLKLLPYEEGWFLLEKEQ